MSKVLVIGAKGTVGSVIANALKDIHEVTEFDLPEYDATDYQNVLEAVSGKDVVIHTAWATIDGVHESWRSKHIEPINVVMEMNILNAVAETKVPRLISASSVHADNFITYKGTGPLTIPGTLKPVSPYGAHKLVMEEVSKFYSRRYGFEFVGLRLGGVTSTDRPKATGKEPLVWLSHGDLSKLIRRCVDVKVIPNSSIILYAVSDNTGKIHDSSNPFGWKPKDDSTRYL